MDSSAKTGKRPGKAKRRILTAAARLFRGRGFDRCTVRELADEVGILSGSLFHHFRSKDDILFAVMEEVIVDMDATLAAALDSAPTTHDELRALIHNQLEFIHGPQADATAVLVYEWNALSPDGQARLLARRNAYFRRWQEVLTKARSEGLTNVDPVVSRQLIHGALVWSANWFDTNGAMTVEELEQAVMSMILV
ncbi:TetR/AcrR family transcriptional regulator [Sedimentitalea sp. JM2-8]|uniref:TetR/AcrR family transcriptional regulator n=1 Tax=Sedimentitalea xiamensis TaxID=3050037 RepID=A0ABT7F9N7_9RHOB|nr:TetR/AcrR family transcriptional regulator [Sedimentitalea xiamensis]MDK3071827.1 TetR/AcrR family transcriptional regulator [Sedimentitalea xiamensis]